MPVSDTNPAAQAVQLRVQREMTGEQRLLLALEMSLFTRELAKEGIRQAHPEWSEIEVQHEFLRRAFLPGHRMHRFAQRQFSMTTAAISASTKVNVTIGPSCTFSTKGGRKQTIQTPFLCRTLGYTIPAEPLVSSLSPSAWEVV